jgi:CheY-like chemotaxis protein
MREFCEHGFEPDIALIDIALPDADGFECLKWLKEQFKGKSVKYIAQTAHVLGEDVKRYEDAGFDGFIGKPYKQEDIKRIIETTEDKVHAENI